MKRNSIEQGNEQSEKFQFKIGVNVEAFEQTQRKVAISSLIVNLIGTSGWKLLKEIKKKLKELQPKAYYFVRISHPHTCVPESKFEQNVYQLLEDFGNKVQFQNMKSVRVALVVRYIPHYKLLKDVEDEDFPNNWQMQNHIQMQQRMSMNQNQRAFQRGLWMPNQRQCYLPAMSTHYHFQPPPPPMYNSTQMAQRRVPGPVQIPRNRFVRQPMPPNQFQRSRAPPNQNSQRRLTTPNWIQQEQTMPNHGKSKESNIAQNNHSGAQRIAIAPQDAEVLLKMKKEYADRKGVDVKTVTLKDLEMDRASLLKQVKDQAAMLESIKEKGQRERASLLKRVRKQATKLESIHKKNEIELEKQVAIFESRIQDNLNEQQNEAERFESLLKIQSMRVSRAEGRKRRELKEVSEFYGAEMARKEGVVMALVEKNKVLVAGMEKHAAESKSTIERQQERIKALEKEVENLKKTTAEGCEMSEIAVEAREGASLMSGTELEEYASEMSDRLQRTLQDVLGSSDLVDV